MKTNSPILIASAVVIVIATWSTAFPADSKSRRKAAEEVLLSMGVDKQLQGTLDQTLDLQIKANPQLAPFRQTMRAFFAKHLSWASLKDEFITIYADAFTEKELKEIAAFYKTPTGKKMVAKNPELVAKGMQMGTKRVQDNQGELQRMIQDEAQKRR